MAPPLTNLLIESLPPRDKAHLLELVEPVALPLRSELFAVGEKPHYVHFITSGLASNVIEMSGGDGLEVGLAGREDLPESLFLLGPQTGQLRCFMQIGGTALRMDFHRFQQIFDRNEAVRCQVLRHVQYEALMTAQLAACSRLHGVEERLARWLLMVAVRIGSEQMKLTQEFLAFMLGSRRATVTIAAGTLQRSGMIEYHRGNIRIVDRERLEETACECFAITQRLLASIYR